MLNFLRSHPYIIAGVIVFWIVYAIGFFALDFTFGESLLLSGVIAVVGVGGYWWKEVGLG